MSLETKKVPLHVPSLQEVADLFKSGLAEHFKNVDVSIEQCPDLTQPPFHLSASGLSGSTAACDIGGVPNLVPLAKVDKDAYDIPTILENLGYKNALAIGAAGGPHQLMGGNCEGMPNVSLKSSNNENPVIENNSYCVKLDPADAKGYKLIQLRDPKDAKFCLLGNLFICEGSPGPVIKVTASERLQDGTNFISILRTILNSKYNEKTLGHGHKDMVSLGGVFLIKSGKAKFHVMPDFSSVPLTSDDDVNNWLRYFEMSAPLVCMSLFHSHDSGHDLRIEHTHGFSQHGDGGHYHYDTTPKDVIYEGYFNIAETLYRIDAPKETHNIGRD